MDIVKRKLYVVGVFVLLAAAISLIVALSREPAQATDVSKDYNKTPQPSTQVLSDTVSQPDANTVGHSAAVAPATGTDPTSAPATPVAPNSLNPSTASSQSVVSTNNNSQVESSDDAATKQATTTGHKQGLVDALLQTVNNLPL